MLPRLTHSRIDKRSIHHWFFHFFQYIYYVSFPSWRIILSFTSLPSSSSLGWDALTAQQVMAGSCVQTPWGQGRLSCQVAGTVGILARRAGYRPLLSFNMRVCFMLITNERESIYTRERGSWRLMTTAPSTSQDDRAPPSHRSIYFFWFSILKV